MWKKVKMNQNGEFFVETFQCRSKLNTKLEILKKNQNLVSNLFRNIKTNQN